MQNTQEKTHRFIRFKKEQILGFLDSERKTDKQIEEQIAENPAHPWIRVMKERLRYKFRSKDDLLLPVLNKGVPDRSIEITTLNLVNNKNVVWWSIGIDLFAGRKINKDERKNMKVMAQLLLSNYLKTNLTPTSSYSYPKLFSLNKKLIIERLRN